MGRISAAICTGPGGRDVRVHQRAGLSALMFGDEFAHLVDGLNAAEVAVALRHAPGEEAMTAEQNSVDAGIFADGFFDEQSQFKAGALPGNPYDLALELLVELFELALAVGAGSERDGPIGMQMIDMRERKKTHGAACRWKPQRGSRQTRRADSSSPFRLRAARRDRDP